MTASKTKSINMKFNALYSYILNTNYRSFGGVFGVFLSVLSLIFVILMWDKMKINQRILFLAIGLTFTVINPVMLAFKAYRQLKLSPSYKKPLEYTFGDEGITVAQGELSQEISWNQICRIMMTKSVLAIYTSRVHAFVIPLSELGSDRGKIIASVVQFTAEYKPLLSKSLKEYQSGKGI